MKITIFIPIICQIAVCVLLFTSCNKENETNLSPNCEITSPSHGEAFKQGDIVIVSVVADDTDGSIEEVVFYIDGESKGSMNNSPYKYNWDTSDENIGNHTIKALVFDNEGASTSAELSIEITEAGSAPVSLFTASPTAGDAPLTVVFSDQSTNNPTSWLWDFGDGNTSTEQNPSNTYNDAGTYGITLTVSNEYGTETLSEDDYISVNVVVAGFSSNITGGTAPLAVIFTDESKSNPTTWLWEFGDGSNSTEQNPSHSYKNMGLYDVSLTATNKDGSNTETKTKFIIVNGGSAGELIDARDDQSYKIVNIGDQTWLANNLNYESPDSWWYDNIEANGDLYGRLYTFEAAQNGCPGGWHLPSDNEWKILEGTVDSQYDVGDPEWDGSYYRGYDAGMRLKSSSGWVTNNGIDAVGFKAFPGGGYPRMAGFDFVGEYAFFWTATETSLGSSSSYSRSLYTTYWKIGRPIYSKKDAYGVRCIRD